MPACEDPILQIRICKIRIPQMTAPERSNGTARALGARVRQARDALNLTQQDLAQHLGINDRQTVSDIESGARRVRPEELVRLATLLKRPLDWFLDPFVVAGEAAFSWRVSPKLPEAALAAFEDRTGPWIGLLRFLRQRQGDAPKPFGKRLWLGERPSFEDAALKGEAVAASLELGMIPAEKLMEQIESKLDIPVLYVDGDPSGGISGAMCQLADLGVILVNRQESLVRRHFDVAHELFHALTWDAMRPQHRESAEATGGKGNRNERLADNFAAAVLIPRKSLDEVLDRTRLDDSAYLAQLARVFHVSTLTFGYRLVNLGLINQAECKKLGRVRLPRVEAPTPKLLSASFVEDLHQGIEAGHVASRKAAKALGMTLEEMASLFTDYGHPVPFTP